MSDRPTFYVDRCLGKGVIRALRDVGANVEAHDDHFAPDAADRLWIPEVTARGWIILTKDKNIRRPGRERDYVIQANARVITLTSGNMRGADMAAIFVQHITEMEHLAVSQPPPFVAILGPGGMDIVFPRSPSDSGSSTS